MATECEFISQEATQPKSEPEASDCSHVAFMFTTMGRPECVRRLIESVRRFYPAMPIYVADQASATPEMMEFYNRHGVSYFLCPSDSGVGYCRSLLARRITEPYLLFGDDDFIFTADTRFDHALRILETNAHIGIVGGSMYDRYQVEDRHYRELRRFEKYIYFDRDNRLFVSIPIDWIEPRIGNTGDAAFYYCDMTLNWCLCRRDVFADERVLWDEQFKSNGEHENFFLQMKLYSPYRVVYFPGMQCEHQHFGTPSYEGLRGRSEGWRRFGAKWGVTQHLEIGMGLRWYQNYDALESYNFNNCGHLGSGPQVPLKNNSFVRLWPDGYAAASQSPSSIVEGLLRDLAARDEKCSAMIREREETIASQALLVEERWDAMQRMEAMIRERDETIASQGKLVSERWEAMQSMNRLIEERDVQIATMWKMVERRDEESVGQRKMIEDRWGAMQQMGQEIYNRDQRIGELQSELAGLRRSASWRVTAPLRFVVTGARRLLRR